MLQTLIATADNQEATVTPAPAQRMTVCAECGLSFKANRPHQQFCSPTHKTAFQNRQLIEGRAIVALAKAWRAGRNVKGNTPDAAELRRVASEALTEMSSILDGFMLEDREAGRPNPLHYAKSLLNNQAGRFIDRQRRR